MRRTPYLIFYLPCGRVVCAVGRAHFGFRIVSWFAGFPFLRPILGRNGRLRGLQIAVFDHFTDTDRVFHQLAGEAPLDFRYRQNEPKFLRFEDRAALSASVVNLCSFNDFRLLPPETFGLEMAIL